MNQQYRNLDYAGYRGKSIHQYPGTMPYPLANDLIKANSEEGQMVLDPFVGTGTILRAAATNYRRSIGIDINPLACLIARLSTKPFDKDKDISKEPLAKFS